MRGACLAVTLLAATPAFAQDHAHHGGAEPQATAQDAPSEMDHAGMDHGEMDQPDVSAGRRIYATTPGTGTSLLPGAEGGMRGVHLTQGGDWMLMAHGDVMLAYTDQGGPRGDDAVYS